MNKQSDIWQAVALSSDVRKKPIRVILGETPIVLFRSGRQEVSALYDRCPHRQVELSTGRVQDGNIECPYHGWQFDGAGQCAAIPGCLGELPHYRVQKFHAVEREGVIFVARQKPSAPPYTHCMEGEPMVVRHVHSHTQSTLIDAAENILDATHTHFTHKGLLRGLNAKRYLVDVEVTRGDDWVEACYTGEDRAQGVISKLLEGERTKTIGRFKYPGIVELEYWSPNGLSLATTFHLRQTVDDCVEGIGWLIGPKQNGLGHIKALAFKPLFNIALGQDRRVLKSANENARHKPEVKPIIGPLDFLRKDIEAIMNGEAPDTKAYPKRFSLEL